MKISQREARRLRRRVKALEDLEDTRNNAWVEGWPGGVNIATIALAQDAVSVVATATARKLGHAVVVTTNQYGLMLYALPLRKP